VAPGSGNGFGFGCGSRLRSSSVRGSGTPGSGSSGNTLSWASPARWVPPNGVQEASPRGASSSTVQGQAGGDIGDLLWYFANVATKLDLELDAIARTNHEEGGQSLAAAGATHGGTVRASPFDDGFPQSEQLPRRFVAEVQGVELAGRSRSRPHLPPDSGRARLARVARLARGVVPGDLGRYSCIRRPEMAHEAPAWFHG